jgi:hypothetical protein
MSKTKRRPPQQFYVWDDEHHEWWRDLYLSFIRGHRPGKDVRHPMRGGGWWEWLDIPGRNCANAKRYQKRRASKMRRREARKELRRDMDHG